MKLRNILAALALTSGPALAQDEMVLLLDWFLNPDHGPIIVAQEKGYFAEQDLSVEVISRSCTCKSTKVCPCNGSARWWPRR